MGIRHQPLRERQRHSATRWNENSNTTQQDQRSQLRAGQITNYIEIRAVILDYYKTISAFSRSTSAVGTNYNGGAAPMDVDNVWRKGRNYKGKGKGKGHHKGSKGKGKHGSKGHYKGFDKGNKGSYNKGKGYSGPKGYGSSKRATKAKETTAKQKEKEATTT